MSVVDAVNRDLEWMGGDLAETGLAATALEMARILDHPGSSPTSKSMCARVLVDTLDRLRELAPEKDEGNQLDELSSRRAARLAGRAAS
jgi:hypothetical protein